MEDGFTLQRAKIEQLKAENNQLHDDGPGTPLGRLGALSKYAVKLGLCTGVEAKPSELFLIDEIERLQKQLRLCQIDNNQAEARIIELERDAEFLRAEIETLQRMRHSEREADHEPRCDCGSLFEICNYPNCPSAPVERI